MATTDFHPVLIESDARWLAIYNDRLVSVRKVWTGKDGRSFAHVDWQWETGRVSYNALPFDLLEF